MVQIIKKIKIIILLLSVGLLFSCSEKDNTSKKNLETSKILDSLTIQKEQKSIEAKKLKSELDSLRKLRDSLNLISK
jgi:hypothetical protein